MTHCMHVPCAIAIVLAITVLNYSDSSELSFIVEFFFMTMTKLMMAMIMSDLAWYILFDSSNLLLYQEKCEAYI